MKTDSIPRNNPADSLEELNTRFHVDPADFSILRKQAGMKTLPGARGKELVQMDINETAERYVSQTAQLIAKLDGSDEDESIKPDHVIYLDKSARPVSWLVNIFWDDMADVDSEDSAKKTARPEHSYLNIDRVNWFTRTGAKINAAGNGERFDGSFGRLGPTDFELDKVSKQDLAGIRALYLEEPIEDDSPGWEDRVFDVPTKLDGKNLTIIDEVQNSGSTLSIASKLLKKAIPELASINGTYFWSDGFGNMVGDELQMGSAPVWYDARNPYGRGIGDISDQYHDLQYQKTPNAKTLARKLGAHVLSAPHHSIKDGEIEYLPDKAAEALMKDFKKLHSEFSAGHVLFVPPMNYSSERREGALADQGFFPDAATGRFSTFADFRSQQAKNRP
jgi:hypothetical protein